MGAVNGEMTSFMATPKELKIIDSVQKIYYTKSKSEVIRMLINAGADKIHDDYKSDKSLQETD